MFYEAIKMFYEVEMFEKVDRCRLYLQLLVEKCCGEKVTKNEGRVVPDKAN